MVKVLHLNRTELLLRGLLTLELLLLGSMSAVKKKERKKKKKAPQVTDPKQDKGTCLV